MYSCHLFLIVSVSVKPILFCPVLCRLCMKCFPDISNFLEEITSLSHSFFFFPSLFCIIHLKRLSYLSFYSLKLCIQMGVSLLFSFHFHISLLFFSQLFVRSSQTTILSFCISFFWGGWSLSPPPVQSNELSPIIFRHFIRSNPLNIFVSSTIIIRDLI